MSGHSEGIATPNARRLLVVDDDVDFAEVLGTLLEDAGFDVRVALSAAEALALLGSFRPDATIVDIRMPIVDGYALLAILRAEPALRACSFVAVSGDQAEAAHAREAFDHFFSKPLETSDLISVLECE